jgi:hypothetical protein
VQKHEFWEAKKYGVVQRLVWQVLMAKFHYQGIVQIQW